MSDAKKCPFCGGSPVICPVTIECVRCTAETRPEDWDRRTPGPATKTLLEWLKMWEPSARNSAENAFIAEWENSNG